ncbi:MAG: hypothetical protein ACKOYP_02100, partial [Bacteroidota bacterium]
QPVVFPNLKKTDTMVKTYISGFIILIAAILMNGTIARLGITGWYEFLTGLSEKGSGMMAQLRIIDWLWLFLFYPLLLGLSAVAGAKIYSLIAG